MTIEVNDHNLHAIWNDVEAIKKEHNVVAEALAFQDNTIATLQAQIVQLQAQMGLLAAKVIGHGNTSGDLH